MLGSTKQYREWGQKAERLANKERNPKKRQHLKELAKKNRHLALLSLKQGQKASPSS